MLPFTPRRRDNLASWMVARSDGDALRSAAGLSVPQTEAGFRAAAGRRAHQSGPGHRTADHAVEPAGSEVIQGTLMVIPIEESLLYVRPAVSARAGRPHPRADPRHRRVSEPDRDGAHARSGPREDFRRSGRAARSRATNDNRPPRPHLVHQSHLPRPPHRPAWPPRRWRRTNARSRRRRPATGRNTARRSSGLARFSPR